MQCNVAFTVPTGFQKWKCSVYLGNSETMSTTLPAEGTVFTFSHCRQIRMLPSHGGKLRCGLEVNPICLYTSVVQLPSLSTRDTYTSITHVLSTCSVKPLPPAVANLKTLVHKYCNTSHFQLDLLTDSLCA